MIPLAKPLVGAREEELLLETLRSGRLALGPRLPEFEGRLGDLFERPISAVSSGTAGLHLAIRAAGIEAGDEVVTTPFSFVASANCLLYENATPVFCDIDPRTLNIEPAAAAAAVGERTTGLLPVTTELRNLRVPSTQTSKVTVPCPFTSSSIPTSLVKVR